MRVIPHLGWAAQGTVGTGSVACDKGWRDSAPTVAERERCGRGRREPVPVPWSCQAAAGRNADLAVKEPLAVQRVIMRNFQ